MIGRTSREVPLSAMAAQPPAQGLLVPGTVTESRSNCQYARRVTFTLRQYTRMPLHQRPLSPIWHAELSPMLRALLEHCRNVFL